MIVFKEKNYTLEEGYYSGPKDMDDLPGTLGTALKGAAAGAVVGGVAGKIADDKAVKGAIKGAKVGFVGGIATKLLVNYVHKPLKKVKFNKVDEMVRQNFGMYRVMGTTVGDSTDKRDAFDERFSCNDPALTNYKINFAIVDGKITMYTFGITKEELKIVNNVLDYYCKKYCGMQYSSRLINPNANAYAVDITFTNYYAIGSFMVEISERLKARVNLLNNDANLGRQQRDFSSKPDFSKISHSDISGKNSSHAVMASALGNEPQDPTTLKSILERLHYVEGSDFTIEDDNNRNVQMSMTPAYLVIVTNKSNGEILDKEFWGHLKTVVKRYNILFGNRAYMYKLGDTKKLEFIIKKLMSCQGIKPNLYRSPKKIGFIHFKDKTFSNTKMTDNLVKKLDLGKVQDYEVIKDISSDTISIWCEDPSKVKVFIPLSLDYAQYEIDNWLRENIKFVRVQIDEKPGRFEVSLRGTLTLPQLYNLVKYIIEEWDFCSIIKFE